MKSKKNLFNDQTLTDFITKTSTFKIILFFTIVTAFYGAYVIGYGIDGFFEPIIFSHTNSYYNVMFFAVLALNTINTSRIFTENTDYIIRLDNRKNYLKKLVVIVTKVNILLIIIHLFSFFTILLFTKFDNFKITEYLDYDINNLSYSVFLLLRYYIYAILFSIINSLFYERFGEKKTMIIDFIFVICFGFGISSSMMESNFSFLPWEYFKLKNYGSFSKEIIISIFYLIIIEVLAIILFKIISQRKKLFTKHLIYNDLNYLLKKQRKILFILILVPAISIIINLNKSLSGLTIIGNTLGLTFDLKSLNMMVLLMYCFNVVAFLYFTFYNYIKDYQTNLDQIYLRKGFHDFYLPKTLLFLVIVLLIKFIQYLPLLLVILIGNYSLELTSLLNLFITDYLYIVTITQIAMSIYLTYIIFKKIRFLIVFIGIIIFINIPVTIVALQEYKNIILFVLVAVIAYNNYLNIRYHKKIIDEVGGK